MLTAKELILFFVCLNLSFYIINETQVLPRSMEGIETPESITAMTYTPLLASITILIGGLGVTAIFRQYVFGTTLTLILFGLSVLLQPVQWIVAGFPLFLEAIGVPEVIWIVLSTLFSFVFFWFLVGIATQRYMET